MHTAVLVLHACHIDRAVLVPHHAVPLCAEPQSSNLLLHEQADSSPGPFFFLTYYH
jgi:hypothetical protein